MYTERMHGQYECETFEENGILMRRCNFCGKVKELKKDFPKNGIDDHGNIIYRPDCKTCYNIRKHENRHKKSHSDFLGSMKRRGEECPEFSFQEWKEAVIFFGGTCAYCGATPRKNEKLTKDHMVPISMNGTTTPDNIVPACSKCNLSKGNQEMKEWFMKQDFFSQERLNKIFQWRTMQRMLMQSRKGAIDNDK